MSAELETGLLIAYCALLIGAAIPIYIGSFGSLKSKAGEEKSESLSSEDAMWFPVMGSGVLFGLYILFTYFSKEYINYLLTAYFAILGVAALTKALSSVLDGLRPALKSFNHSFSIKIDRKQQQSEEEETTSKPKSPAKKSAVEESDVLFAADFDFLFLICGAIAILFTAYYVMTKHWIASNIFGEAFSISAIQLLDLDDFKTGMLLLSGLFIYDIFWVFGTEVMVTVAKNFDAPIKILFPKDVFASELKFSMLGLGDIVIPGIFVALCLRFDRHMAGKKVKGNNFPKPYFTACFIAYILGLITTVVVMHTFQAAQPALLYLSPACILSVLITAAARGELKQLFAYQSENKVIEEKTKKQK